MVHPISERTDVQAATAFSDFTPKSPSASLLTKSTLSSYSGYCQSIFDCFGGAWQWIKTHIFCCFSKSTQESTETTDTCSIPVITEGTWIDKELNQEIRSLYSIEVQNHPEWASFPKDLALLFQQICEEIETREFTTDDPMKELDIDNRLEDIPHFSEVKDLIDPNKAEVNLELFSIFININSNLNMKIFEIRNAQEIPFHQNPEAREACPFPVITEGDRIDIELNRNIRSLYSIELQNHPEWTRLPKDLALLFFQIHQELNSIEFTEDPSDVLNIRDRIKNTPFYKEVKKALKLTTPDKINSSEIENLSFKQAFWKTFTSLMIKSLMIKKNLEEQQT